MAKHHWYVDDDRVCRCRACDDIWTKANREGECSVRKSVREAAAELGFVRYTATYDDEKGGDVDRDLLLTEKLNELAGNRAWFRGDDGRIVEVARLFLMF